jgi:hypothetical protein
MMHMTKNSLMPSAMIYGLVKPSPLLDYIERVRQESPGGWVTVALAEVLPARWWETLLHNQRALLIKAALLFKFRVIVTDVPYHLGPY